MKLFSTSLRIIFVFTILTGVVYPLCSTLYGKILFSHKAEGSIITVNGKVKGSELIGQKFENDRYFHGRVSASNYDALSSGGSNLGPSNPALTDRIRNDVTSFQKKDKMPNGEPIPENIVTASASGLDPHINIDAALMQCGRISKIRGASESDVKKIVYSAAQRRYFDIAGESFVNVLQLNMILDQRYK
jgi:K+-transporting ATPase ATPase C chain